MCQGCLDQRENQESQEVRACRAPQASQGLQALVALLDHLASQVPKGNQASQGPLGSLEWGSREWQDFMAPQGSLVPWVLKVSLAFLGPQALQGPQDPQP